MTSTEIDNLAFYHDNKELKFAPILKDKWLNF